MNDLGTDIVEAARAAGIKVIQGEPVNFDAPFTSEEKVLEQFYEENNLQPHTEIIQTHGGRLYQTSEGIFLFTKNATCNQRVLDIIQQQEEHRISPNFGGPGRSSTKERTYKLSGKLNSKPIHLIAIATETQRYTFNESLNFSERGYKPSGDPYFRIERDDDSPLWFVRDAKIETD